MKLTTKSNAIAAAMFSFFIMGFVDVVGISTSYIKKDFELSDTIAGFIPLMVFLWFAVFSIPTSFIMNKAGRKKTVCFSLLLTSIAMLIPLISYNFKYLLIAFALLGIGNTILQVSLNPLITNIVSKDRLTSTLTFGQFIKAISSFLGPIIASWSIASIWGWKLIFPIYSAISILSLIWLMTTKVDETKSEATSSVSDIIKLLANRKILIYFLGIFSIVGIDVGLNVVIPNLLVEKSNYELSLATLGPSLYFIARTTGAFAGGFILAKLNANTALKGCIIGGAIGLFTLIIAPTDKFIFCGIIICGLFFANIFSIIFSLALTELPEKANEISGLMIVGVSGGAIIPPLMGYITDISNSYSSSVYLLFISLLIISFSTIKKQLT